MMRGFGIHQLWVECFFPENHLSYHFLQQNRLVAIALLIAWEAVEHLQAPEPILGLPLLIAAGLSIVTNGLIVNLLHADSHHNLNLRGVFLHGVADAASSIGLILAAVAVHFFRWFWADAVVSFLVALLICLSSLSLVKDSLQLLRRELT